MIMEDCNTRMSKKSKTESTLGIIWNNNPSADLTASNQDIQTYVLSTKDILVQIFVVLDLAQLIEYSRVCKKWYEAAKSSKVWGIKFLELITGSVERSSRIISTHRLSSENFLWEQHLKSLGHIPKKLKFLKNVLPVVEESEEDVEDVEDENEDPPISRYDQVYPVETEDSHEKEVEDSVRRFAFSDSLYALLLDVTHHTARVNPKRDDYGTWRRSGSFRMIFCNLELPNRYIQLDGRESFSMTENIPDFNPHLRLSFKLHEIAKPKEEAQCFAIEIKPKNRKNRMEDISEEFSFPLMYFNDEFPENGAHNFTPKEFQPESDFLKVENFLAFLQASINNTLQRVLSQEENNFEIMDENYY